jgi:hypothetical protein
MRRSQRYYLIGLSREKYRRKNNDLRVGHIRFHQGHLTGVFVNVRQQLATISSFSMSPTLQDSDPPPLHLSPVLSPFASPLHHVAISALASEFSLFRPVTWVQKARSVILRVQELSRPLVFRY